MTGTDVEGASRTTCGHPPAAHLSLALPTLCGAFLLYQPRLCCLLSSCSRLRGIRAYCPFTSAPTGLWNKQNHFLNWFLWSPFSPDDSVSAQGNLLREWAWKEEGVWSCLVWLWGESIRSRAPGELGHLLGKGQRKSKEQDGEETVKSQYSEQRRGALEAQHWFSTIYQVIVLFV